MTKEGLAPNKILFAPTAVEEFVGTMVVLTVTVLKLEQPSNKPGLTCVTPAVMVILGSEVQLLNILVPKNAVELIDLGRLTVTKAVHPSNNPAVVAANAKLAGRLTVVKLVQSLKAKFEIVVTLSDKFREVKPVQPSKAETPIVIKDVGN